MLIYRSAEHLPPFPGGKEIHVVELSSRQVALGHHVSLWFRYGGPELPGVELHRVRPPRRRLGIISAASFGAAAAKGMRRRPAPDVVHVHGDFLDGYVVARAAHRVGRPVVMTVHGGLNPVWRAPSRYAFRHIDAFIAVSENVAADLARCGVAPASISVIPSGINLELLAPWIDSKAVEPGHVVTVGSLDAVKGIDVILDAFRRLRATRDDLRLTIVGDGPERARLEEIAGSDPAISFTGRLSRREVYERLARAELFVLASRPLRRKSEGTPTAVLEALAVGVPVVATTTGGLASLLRHDVDAVLVPPDDAPALANAISRVVSDGGLRRRLAAHGHDVVRDRGWDSVAAAVDDVYRRVLSR